MFIKVLV